MADIVCSSPIECGTAPKSFMAMACEGMDELTKIFTENGGTHCQNPSMLSTLECHPPLKWGLANCEWSSKWIGSLCVGDELCESVSSV